MPTLDPHRLSALGDELGDTDLVREVVELYLSELPTRRAALRTADAEGDMGRIRTLAHTLGSASAMVGAQDLQQACRALEDSQADRPDAPHVQPLVTHWLVTCDLTETALRGWLRG